MNHVVLACLGLVATLFLCAITLIAYHQMKLKNPERDGYFKLQDDLHSMIGAEDLATWKQSKPVRIFSFVLSCSLTIAAIGFTAFHSIAALV